ncbi:4-hydroxythreonine-4-phosphate dehydrogenase [gamma proteobacterium HTCC5015]|nr:4-hydroxythreonine-4-phosphate dehydrogenase [gamma proteobacterium HTCC5015]
MTQSTPRIAITAGEPAGIGPDIILAALQQPFCAELVVVADPQVLQARADQLGVSVPFVEWHATHAKEAHDGQRIKVWPIAKCPESVLAGELNPRNAAYVVETLTQAARACLQGTFDALVTAPVHKGVINEAGVPFSGHTELFGELSEAHPVMMLAAGDFRVALATTHLPLSAVPEAVTPDVLCEVLRILDRDLRQRYNIARPHILVCGLNPHAGEGGHLGREEIEVIEPTLDRLRTEGLNLAGPLPADTLFTPRHLEGADAVLAMYHDQGLPVLKYAGFGRAVNITLGLPIVRTSVDHGTALDLAGTGRAEHGSLVEAIHQALKMI